MRPLSPRAALLLATLLPALAPASARGQARPAATVREVEAEYPTYPFGDPNPIPVVGLIYPYFRFDGFSATAVPRRWKVVELENAYLKVQILPEIGGKIWNAVEKRTGRSFIYDNRVVKFRDIAMRGPWTSGGIEANYGIIGHTPAVATPVDYVTRTHPDGSVSCVIGTLDLLTRTPWRLEIRLGADEAAFTTTSFWHNASGLEQPYYSWMNAGIPVGGGLQFIYPGTSRLGHDGERGPWPVDEAGRDLSRYDRNDFGGYKSYHVFGRATDFFGAYWHDQDFGMVRHAARDEKAGKKIWIWGLSRQGMIWESLLTDRDGQYAEVQSGRLFNQTAEASTFTPFKHRGFTPQQVDRWTETWYPVVGTKGFVTAGRTAAMNVVRLGDRLAVTILPVAPVADTLVATVGGRRVAARAVVRRTMQPWTDTLAFPGVPLDSLRLTLGDGALDYALAESAGALARPVEAPPGFDWRSAYGHWLRGKEWLRQREYALARAFLDSALLKDPHYVPALADRALLAVRSGEHERARKDAALALSVDSYDGQANYAYGLANRALGKLDDARDGFEIAAQSAEYRVAAWVELARMAAAAGAWTRATEQSRKALAVAGDNPDALGVALLAARRAGNAAARDEAMARLAAVDPLSVQLRLERALAAGDPAPAATVARGLRSELPEQQLLELAGWYLAAGDSAAAMVALEGAGEIPEALYWRAALAPPTQRAGLVARGDAVSPRLVFPFRPELVPALREAARGSSSWRPRYYLGLALWGMGQVARADSILTSLGTTPDHAPFYAARASLPARPGSEARRDLRRAAALDSAEWRYGKLLADHALAHGDALSAVTYAQGAYARFPANYILGLTLARALVAAGRWADADALLARLEVLPYEGARDGRTLYREAKVGLARAAIAAGRWDRADTLVAAARLWPERLGAGKPYDADVDEATEDSLAAVIAAGRRGAAPRAVNAPRAARPPRPDTLVYGTGVWEPDSLGNHRAVLEVDEAADAVTVRIPWRRRDRTPERINVVVTNGTTGLRILNVARVRIDRDSGVVVFQAPAAGRYHAYYLPYTGTFRSNYPRIGYRPVEDTADSLWLARTGLAGAPPAAALAVANGLPHAAVIGFDAMDAFSAFTPMEYIATQAERRALLAMQGTQPFLAFAEDRALAIRMPDDIPGTWARRGAFRPFAGTARRGEFYSFQVGLWAHRGPVDGVRYRATPLRSAAGGVIPASALTGFNFEGTDWSGRRFTRTLRVDSGAVQALWFGVDVPVGTRPGTYRGRLAVVTAAGTREIPLALTVSATVAPNHGDDVPADLTRLRWLNSQLAADDSVVAPYTPLRLAGRTVSLLGRDLTFGEDGLPAQLRS
ncbi:MAG: DUF5107 domain-containing protein, partial [Gemmatimonadetes bacterium]|nr:DUF5107 domain-containing protein [Gemmatimonadota bacterium]